MRDETEFLKKFLRLANSALRGEKACGGYAVSALRSLGHGASPA